MSHALKVLTDDELPWHSKGLRFSCTGCGKCCTGAPGYIWVNEKEVEAIAKHLKVDVREFAKRYLRQVGNRLSLKEDPENFDCVFLSGKECQIYSERPTQCRTYPWWPQILTSEDAWKREAQCCEGINEDAPLVPGSKISEDLNTHLHQSPMQ